MDKFKEIKINLQLFQDTKMTCKSGGVTTFSANNTVQGESGQVKFEK